MVLVDERSRMACDIAHRSERHTIGVSKPAQTTTDEDPVDGRWRPTEQRTQAIRSISDPGSSLEDLRFGGVIADRNDDRAGTQAGQAGFNPVDPAGQPSPSTRLTISWRPKTVSFALGCATRVLRLGASNTPNRNRGLSFCQQRVWGLQLVRETAHENDPDRVG